MSEMVTLAADRRERAGKGAARQTRRAGRIPAVIYGNKLPPLMISLELQSFEKILRRKGFLSHLFDVTVDGTAHRVLPRDVQFDPVSDKPVHVDFLRVATDTRITVDVPCVFVNQDKSPGIKRGGVLNVVRYKIEMLCRADAIPEQITVDLAGADLGASIHISHIPLPEGVAPTITDRDFTVCTIAVPSGVKSDAAEGGEAAAEPAKA
ncbi:MAG: 50S ribosomal protein L25/general stress protein Ctc [Azospirillum sp.]|nr:50S ribosomal protein L25/general stress protein Ctc [Azospirillum sp.]